MNTTCDFLDAIKARHGVPSDYALAKLLGVTHQTISKYRVGKDYLGDSMAIQVAKLLELDPAVILAAVHGERAKKPDEKAIWNALFEKLGGIAAALFIGIGGLSAPAPAQASPTAQNGTGIVIMSTRQRYTKRRKSASFAWFLPLEVFFLLKHAR